MSQTFLNYFSSLTGIRKLQDQSAILTAPTLELLDQSIVQWTLITTSILNAELFVTYFRKKNY